MSGRLLCPRCGAPDNRRINSRRYKAKRLAELNVVARAHVCLKCGKEWTSVSAPMAGVFAEAVRSLMEL